MIRAECPARINLENTMLQMVPATSDATTQSDRCDLTLLCERCAEPAPTDPCPSCLDEQAEIGRYDPPLEGLIDTLEEHDEVLF